MENYIILIPNSETKLSGGDEEKVYRVIKNLKKYNYFLNIENERNYLYSKLKEVISLANDEINLEEIFELKGKKLQEAVELCSDMLNLPCLNVISRMNGEMYKAIDFDSLNNFEKEIFLNNVFIVDALFGILKSSDFVPEYKLKFKSKFLDLNVEKYWKNNLRGIFDTLFKNKIIIDLLPESHRKVVSRNQRDKYFQINFCELKNGKLINVGHNSKKLKGELIRYLVSFKEINEEILFSFKHSMAYEYSKEYSFENQIIFLKN